MCGDRGVASGLLAVQSKRCSCGFDSAVPAGQRFIRRLVCRNASTTLMRQKECVTQRRNDRSRQGVFARPPWEERDEGVFREGRHCERVFLSARSGDVVVSWD